MTQNNLCVPTGLADDEQRSAPHSSLQQACLALVPKQQSATPQHTSQPDQQCSCSLWRDITRWPSHVPAVQPSRLSQQRIKSVFASWHEGAQGYLQAFPKAQKRQQQQQRQQAVAQGVDEAEETEEEEEAEEEAELDHASRQQRRQFLDFAVLLPLAEFISGVCQMLDGEGGVAETMEDDPDPARAPVAGGMCVHLFSCLIKCGRMHEPYWLFGSGNVHWATI